ncbi:MAG: hypothetical protein RLW42_16320, partial [Gammaproteobacteria bacterium]
MRGPAQASRRGTATRNDRESIFNNIRRIDDVHRRCTLAARVVAAEPAMTLRSKVLVLLVAIALVPAAITIA